QASNGPYVGGYNKWLAFSSPRTCKNELALYLAKIELEHRSLKAELNANFCQIEAAPVSSHKIKERIDSSASPIQARLHFLPKCACLYRRLFSINRLTDGIPGLNTEPQNRNL